MLIDDTIEYLFVPSMGLSVRQEQSVLHPVSKKLQNNNAKKDVLNSRLDYAKWLVNKHELYKLFEL